MTVLLFLTLFLSFTYYSSATYCLCKPGAQDASSYQRVIDYACGAGADCRAIQPNGPCFVDNNPKAICDYAVNSYFQNKGQVPDSCVFSNVAYPSNNSPTTVPSGCTFPSSGSPTSTTQGGINTGTPGSSTGIFSPTGMGPIGGVPDYNNGNKFTCTPLLLTLALLSGLVLWV